MEIIERDSKMPKWNDTLFWSQVTEFQKKLPRARQELGAVIWQELVFILLYALDIVLLAFKIHEIHCFI